MVGPGLQDVLSYAGQQSGVQVEVYAGRERGHHRHEPGTYLGGPLGAADVELRDPTDGHLLTATNPADREKMATFITASRAAGATGIGHAGPSEKGGNYMGSSGIHVGTGPEAVWGKKGKTKYVPDWVSKAYYQGETRQAQALAQQELVKIREARLRPQPIPQQPTAVAAVAPQPPAAPPPTAVAAAAPPLGAGTAAPSLFSPESLATQRPLAAPEVTTPPPGKIAGGTPLISPDGKPPAPAAAQVAALDTAKIDRAAAQRVEVNGSGKLSVDVKAPAKEVAKEDKGLFKKTELSPQKSMEAAAPTRAAAHGGEE
jgi:hypothetical protein